MNAQSPTPDSFDRRTFISAGSGLLTLGGLMVLTMSDAERYVTPRSSAPEVASPEAAVRGVPPLATAGRIKDALNPTRRFPRTRNLESWPFSPRSVWNMPIGTGAEYRQLGMHRPTVGFGTDEVYVVLDQRAPKRRLMDRGYWWPWRSGDEVPGKDTGVLVRVPDHLVIPPPPTEYNLPNRPTVAYEGPGTVRDFQYTVRPTPGSDISMFEYVRGAYRLDGDGVTPVAGDSGGHGGSGLPTLGGAIRDGELTSPEPIRHALAVTLNMNKWGSPTGSGMVWPATYTDIGYRSSQPGVGYGTVPVDGALGGRGLAMGSLLAIPAHVDLFSLDFETYAGAKLAWTHQNYGAYIVDTSMDTGDFDVHRLNVDIRVVEKYPELDTPTDTPFGRDMSKIFESLAVIENNGPDTIGGSGRPLQPLAPARYTR